MMTALKKRYQVAIDKIGHAKIVKSSGANKRIVKNTKDLKTKTDC